MGNLFTRDFSKKDVLLTGLRGAGKTLLLYNALLEEGWTETYRSYDENKKRNIQDGFQDKYISIKPTVGFNRELFQDKVDFNVWDIGGC